MSAPNNTTTNYGSPIVGLLGVAFVVLKLTGYITWPWIWVLAPFWMGIAIFLVIVIFLFFIALVVSAFK